MKNIFIIFLFFVSTLLFSQQKDGEPKKITFSIGPEFRITPIWLSGKFFEDSERAHIMTNEDPHLSGSALTYTLFYSPKKIKWNFGIGQSFRYDLLFYDDAVGYSSEDSQHNPVKTLMIDYHFRLEKYFVTKNDLKLKLQLGFSLMDRSTDYAISEVHNEGTVAEYSYTHTEYFNYTSYTFAFGISKNRLNAYLGTYFTELHQFYYVGTETPFFVPYILINYDLLKI